MVIQLSRLRVACFEARVYCGAELIITHSAMSEGGARTWLADKGFPFHKQPRYVTVKRR